MDFFECHHHHHHQGHRLNLGSHGVLQIREPVLATTLPVCAPAGRTACAAMGRVVDFPRQRGNAASQPLGMPRVRRNFSIRHYVVENNSTSAPDVDCTGPAPVTEHVDTSPAVTYQAPAPVIGYAEPAVIDTAPAPVIKYAAEPAVTHTAPAPVNENVAPAPADSHAAPAYTTASSWKNMSRDECYLLSVGAQQGHFGLDTCNVREDGIWYRFRGKQSALVWSTRTAFDGHREDIKSLRAKPLPLLSVIVGTIAVFLRNHRAPRTPLKKLPMSTSGSSAARRSKSVNL